MKRVRNVGDGMIEVRLFATFRDGREKKYKMDMQDIAAVDDILDKLGIGKEEVAICLVNGFHQTTDAVIKDNDVISLFPPVGGG